MWSLLLPICWYEAGGKSKKHFSDWKQYGFPCLHESGYDWLRRFCRGERLEAFVQSNNGRISCALDKAWSTKSLHSIFAQSWSRYSCKVTIAEHHMHLTQPWEQGLSKGYLDCCDRSNLAEHCWTCLKALPKAPEPIFMHFTSLAGCEQVEPD